MANKEKGHAKIAHRAKPSSGEVAAGAFVMVSDGHRISRAVTGLTDCGEHFTGWRYGTKADVLCGRCA